MEANFTYMGRKFSDLTLNDSSSSSSAFSDCNSDRSGEFPTASSESRRLFLACASDNSDQLISQLVAGLASDCPDGGSLRGKKDACTALYSLCGARENKVRAVQAGIMKPLVEMMSDLGSSMVDKSAFVLSLLVPLPEARVALVEEGGIPVLVEIVEVGTHRQKEIAVAILLQLCQDSVAYRTMVAREGAIPPLVALSQSGTSRAKQKAEALIELLRQPRSANAAATTV
ncbi:ARM repeat superfamily protein [Striga hermonthica]|uniref:ARM repeat superfamily protein n=1 Tax=Striga hermonthica TaxID=68872 RepID=A0A9N7NWM1_STRHE|nr:ARM repeat superfamily protein [Striga hermonthica]